MGEQLRSFDRLPVEFLNDIAFLQSGGGGGRTRVNRDDHRALYFLWQVQCVADIIID